MVDVVSFDSVRADIIGYLRKNMLIPILGSGFSCGCNSLRGTVPSGSCYKKYMAEKIICNEDISDSDKESLYSMSFSEIASIYHQIVPLSEQRSFLRDNFTKVMLDETRGKFLSYNWPYIYTLNIDDAIEQNSQFTQVVYSNREINECVFDDTKCVIKLHGDIAEMLSFEDSKSEIFDKEQYILSLQKNKSLLKHLTNDFIYNTPIFIGCSLNDEIDLLSASMNAENSDSRNVRYYCTTSTPTRLEKLKLDRYKIDKCVVFNSYDEIYEELLSAAEEALRIRPDEIENYKAYSFSYIDSSFESNKSYLFHGKMLINKDRTITLPYFFISRDVTDTVVDNITKHNKNIQFLLGSGCCGKTYIAIDVIRRIRDRDVFAFSSIDSLSNKALDVLLEHRDCLVIADRNSLQIQQIERILKASSTLSERNIFFVIIERKNNRDLLGLIKLLELTGEIVEESIPKIEVKSHFNDIEIRKINKQLVATTLGVFSEKRSIADNIIHASNKLIEKNRFSAIAPKSSNIREIASLIALATKQKVYSSEAVELDLADIFPLQERSATPLIESEGTWAFERSDANNSPLKYVINAKYWLYDQLSHISESVAGRALIVDAYKYIVTMLIEQHGRPELDFGDKNAYYKPYILFDEINQIFNNHGLDLIREIYISLNDLLATDPHYMHQRAKCYIRSANITTNEDEKLAYLENAYRDATVAYSVFEKRYDHSNNEKIYISIAHAEYTIALALCHLARSKGYSDITTNTKAIELLCAALNTPYNSYDFIKKDRYNYGNVVEDTIHYIVANKDLILDSAHEPLAELLKNIIAS